MTDEAVATLATIDERYGRLRLVVPSAERAVRESMARLGQLHPVTACVRGSCLAVVDGFKRLHAARALGQDTLRVRAVELGETAAIAALVSLNRGGRGISDLEEAQCVRALCREHGLAQLAVAELLGRDKSWVSRRLSLAEQLCDVVASDVRAGLVSTTVAREVARLPRGNQAEVAATITRELLTSREAARLVSLFEASSGDTQREYLLTRPREAIAAHEPIPQTLSCDPRLGPRTQLIRQRLYAVMRMATDVTQRLEDCTPCRWTDTEHAVLDPLIAKTLGVATLLVDKLRDADSTLRTGHAA